VDLSLSASECRLLRHLALADMPYSDQDATPAAVRGLDGEHIQDDVRSLKWRGMVAAEGGSLSLTPLGAAAHYAAQVELLSARLVDMSVLADELERLNPSLAREMHAVRQVAVGAWSLEEATRYGSGKNAADAD
jgi:hypothetical protein